MLYLTSVVVYLGMVISLWMAAYLLARGFFSRVTWRAVIIMVLLAIWFYSAYVNLIDQAPGSSVIRTVMLIFAVLAWYDLTYQLVPAPTRGTGRPVRIGFFALGGLLTIVLLASWPPPSGATIEPVLSISPQIAPIYVAVALFDAMVIGATLYNFVLIARAGAGPAHRFFFIATCLAALAAARYYLLALPGMAPFASITLRILALLAVLVLGYAVARHQAFIERRTTLHDFPISGLAVVGLAGLYALLAEQRGFSRDEVALITVLAILTHSGIDLVREFLDRLLNRSEGELRGRLRQLARDVGGDSDLPDNLHHGLEILCQRLGAQGAFVALKQAEGYVVAATLSSRQVGKWVEGAECDDLAPPGPDLAGEVDWLAPVFAGGEQVAVIGLGPPRTTRSKYTDANLDLLAETADWVGLMWVTNRQRLEAHERLDRFEAEEQTREKDSQAGAEDLLSALGQDPPPEFVRLVEEALRHVTDYAVLGESPLAAQINAPGTTHVERGKALRERLIQALETLRPAAKRPAEPLPREWHGYVVLNDAYLDDVPNREIMARLYVSQGTFNRVRRKALRSVARNLLEMTSAASPAG